MIISLFYVILAAADHDKRITVSLVLACSSCSFKILVLVVMAVSIVNSDHN